MKKKILMMLLVIINIVSCSPKNSNLPQEIVWDREICAHCSMAVSDKRFAAQIKDEHGKFHFFEESASIPALTAKYTLKTPTTTDKKGLSTGEIDHRAALLSIGAGFLTFVLTKFVMQVSLAAEIGSPVVVIFTDPMRGSKTIKLEDFIEAMQLGK